ncbi:MAG: acyltransferase family protein [Desulfarculaceae bacterium]|nr:acyltransferase family protein [Desulfarculaceae bacterium]
MTEDSFTRQTGKPAPSTARLYYLDWLRITAILFVFLHHCAKFYDFHTFTIFDEPRSLAMSAFREFNFLWMMPLFFVISGAAVFLSFRSRKVGGFLKERLLRILVPLLLVGTFVIGPSLVYLERLFQGKTTLNFFAWYPHFFDGIYLAGGNFTPPGVGTHLWYLLYLFVFSLIGLPLFINFGKSESSLLTRAAGVFQRPWALPLLFLPVSAASVLAESAGLGITRIAGGWDPLSFLVFFLCGYVVYCREATREVIRRFAWVYLVAAVVLSWLHLDSHFGLDLVISGVTRHGPDGALLPFDRQAWMLVLALRGLLGWCWVLALLGLGERLLNRDNRVLDYANPAVLPFYVIHFSVIYLVGYYLIQWDLNPLLEFGIIAILSFVGIMLIYEYFIRRINALRFLLGMKLIKK